MAGRDCGWVAGGGDEWDGDGWMDGTGDRGQGTGDRGQGTGDKVDFTLG